MSIQHVNLIYELPLDLTAGEVSVLNRLAARADKQKHLSFPGAALLARETRMSKPGVRVVLRHLEQKGYITGFKGTAETHYCTLYEMTYALPHWKEELDATNGAKPFTPRPANSSLYSNSSDRRPGETAMEYARRLDKR